MHRAVTVSVFVIAIATFNFLDLSGSKYIRAVHVINLLEYGIGLFLEYFIGLFKTKK